MTRSFAFAALAFAAGLAPLPALAVWTTSIDANGVATMVGVEQPDWALVVTCTSAEDMAIAIVEARPIAPPGTPMLQVQADTDQNYGFDTERYRHNAEFEGVRTIWLDYANLAVEAMGAAFNTVNIHLTPPGGAPMTFTLSSAGSRAEVDRLFEACDAAPW